jgi:hypothetical protein
MMFHHENKMSVLINYLLQNTNLVSVLSKICPNFAGHVWQDWHISRTLTGIEVFQKKNLPFSIINIFVSLPHVNPELSVSVFLLNFSLLSLWAYTFLSVISLLPRDWEDFFCQRDYGPLTLTTSRGHFRE